MIDAMPVAEFRDWQAYAIAAQWGVDKTWWGLWDGLFTMLSVVASVITAGPQKRPKAPRKFYKPASQQRKEPDADERRKIIERQKEIDRANKAAGRGRWKWNPDAPLPDRG